MKIPFFRVTVFLATVLLAAASIALACETGRPEPVRNLAIASRAGTATLIGFTEYIVSDQPPRKFRRQVTAGTLFTGQWSVAGCPGLNEPKAFQGSFPPSEPSWSNSAGSVALEPVEVDAVNNRVKYRLTRLGFANHSDSSPWGDLWGLRMVAAPADGSSSEVWTYTGQERWLSRAAARSPYDMFIQGFWSLAGWIGHTETRQFINVRGAVDRSVRDEWDETVEYTLPEGVVAQTGMNARYVGIASFPLATGGTPEAWPNFGSAATAYGDLVTVTTPSTTERRIAGRGECLGAAPRFERAEGVVTQELSLEDTEDDAMARAPVVEGADRVAYRDRRTTGFSFDFAEFSFEVPLQVACEGTYLVHFHFQRRSRAGAGEPVRFTRTLEKRLTAGHQTLAPGWFDVAAMELHLPEGEVVPLDYDTEYRLLGVELEQACPDAEPGKDQIWRDSVHVHLSLGRGPGGRSAGRIALEADAISPELYAPGALAVAVPYGSGTVVVRDAAGQLRQVRAPAAFVDIVVTGEAEYEVRFFTAAVAGEPDPATGLSIPVGTPYLVYRVENPDAAAAGRLRVSRIKGDDIRVSEFGQDADTGVWTFATGNGLRREAVEVLDFGESRIETIAVSGPDGIVVAESEREIRRFDWGEETVREVRDPAGAALATVSAFVATPGQPGYATRPRRDYPYGAYEEWAYDYEDRPVEHSRPSADGGVRRTLYLYDELADADGDATPEQLTTTIESVGDTEVGRTHAIRWSQRVSIGAEMFVRRSEVRCATAGANWDAAGNLVTETLLYGAGPWNGQPRRRLLPDGTVQLMEHSLEADGRQVTIASVGAPNPAGDAVVAGTRTTTVADPAGRIVSESTVDVASGRELSRWQATEFDFLGRPVRLVYADGTFVTREYSCCGLAREVDRTGLVTAHSYDELGRRVETERDGLTHRTEYDAEDRITARVRVGTDGSEIRVEARRYDLAGRLVEERDAMDRVTVHQEELQPVPGVARRYNTTAPDGGTRIEDFNGDGSVASIGGTAVAPRGYHYGVDAEGEFTQEFRPSEPTEPGGLGGSTATEWTKTVRDFLGRPWKTVHADGSAEYVRYNERGQAVRRVDADGVTVMYAYNPQGERDTVAVDLNGNDQIDPAGPDRITRVTEEVGEREGHTVLRRLVQVWAHDGDDAAKSVETVEHSTDGKRGWFTRHGLTTTVTTELDGAGGRTVTTVGPDGVRETRTLAADRLLTVSVEAPDLGVVQSATYAYDAYHRPASVTDARNGTTLLTHHADGQVHSITSPDPDPMREGGGYDPQETILHYDMSGRLTRVQPPDGAEVHTTYWPTGQVRRAWGARTYPVEYTYDAQGRLSTLTTWQDFAGDTGRAVTAWNYDPQRGWLVGKTHADGAGPTYAYYPSGRLRTRTWARQPMAAATYRYDAAGALAGIDYSDQTADVEIACDRLGRPRQVTDGAGVCQYAYNDSDRLTDETYTDGLLRDLTVGRTFDAWSRLDAVAVRQAGTLAGADLHATTYAYDAASRLERVTTGESSATYGYLAGSSLPATVAFREAGELRLTVTREFDRLNRLTAISHASAVGGELAPAHGYTYDAAGLRTEVRREDATAWSYDYDQLGQLIGAVQRDATGEGWLGRDFAFAYDDSGNRRTATRRLPAPWATLEESYAANLLNQYEQRTVPRFVEVTGAAEPGATVTVMHPEDNGSVYPVQRQGAWFYAQVPAGAEAETRYEQFRVAGVASNAGPAGEDAVTEEIRGVVMPASAEIYRHDADGNLVEDAHWSYEWDAENRLIAMQTAPGAVAGGAPETRLEFAYDARSRRVAKKVMNRQDGDWSTTAHRLFVYDGWNLLAELDALQDRAPVRLCTWGADLSGTLQGAGGVGGLLFTRESMAAGTLAPCYDGNGNVTGLYDLAADRMAASYDYGPFGELLAHEGPAAAANPFRFSTKYTDPETDLLYYGYRYYHPTTGRWLNRDPLGEAGGVNLYRACKNDLGGRIDALGLYEPDGHFYPGYVIGRLNRMSDSDAYAFAYYSQYPDQVKHLDAIKQGLGFGGNLLRMPAAPLDINWLIADSGKRLEIQRIIHALTGDGITDVLKYRKCLVRLMRDGKTALWEKGILAHALGDTFAHLYGAAGREKAHRAPWGHVGNGHTPDNPTNNPNQFLSYLKTLNQALGGQATDVDLQHIASRLTTQIDDDSGRMANARGLAQEYGFQSNYDPSIAWARDPAMPEIDSDAVTALIEKVKGECCR